jgi:hypothetical protein
VSHYFELPGVLPERSISVESTETGETHKIHLWILPLSKPADDKRSKPQE